MENFLFAVNAVLPILLLISLGYFLKKIKLLNEQFLTIANKLCFYITLPVLLFKNIYDVNLTTISWRLILFIVISILTIFIIGLIVVRFFVKDRSKKGVLLQCFFRSNFAFIGIPLANSLFSNGSTEANMATATVAIASIFVIPIFNILSVISLSLFTTNKVNVKKIIINIGKNPLIIGVLIGLSFSLFRLIVPSSSYFIKDNVSFIYKTISNISAIASPLALIVLGGQFEFSFNKELTKYISIATIARVVLAPVLVIIIAILLNMFSNYEYAVLISVFASPVAVASAIMAKEMDNDYKLAGQLVVWTTITFSFTVFIIILAMKSLGYL